MTNNRDEVPTFDRLINPTLRALHHLGGSAGIHELVNAVITDMGISEDLVEVPHLGKASQTELEYRSAWTRTYLKNYGLIENSSRGVWSLTAEGNKSQEVDEQLIVRSVRQQQRRVRESGPGDLPFDDEPDEPTWNERLIDILLGIDPSAFERLCQRLLRESGFIEVEGTGRSGDGGLDGHGTLRIGGLVSFNVLFQSKRYRGNIGPDVVRDFRGAMVGRADKGLIITTGGFTRDALREATRDGAPPIDLIDGELLAYKLKELRLGVGVTMVEEISVNEEWFRAL